MWEMGCNEERGGGGRLETIKMSENDISPADYKMSRFRKRSHLRVIRQKEILRN